MQRKMPNSRQSKGRSAYVADFFNPSIQVSGNPCEVSCAWPFHPISGHPLGNEENGGRE